MAVFPAERAVFAAPATPELDALVGVALAPEELIDLLVGVPSPASGPTRCDGGDPPEADSGRAARRRAGSRRKSTRRRPDLYLPAPPSRRRPATATGRSTRTRRDGSGARGEGSAAASPRSTSAWRCWAGARTATTSSARSSRRSISSTTSCCAGRTGSGVRCDHPLVPEGRDEPGRAGGGGAAPPHKRRGGRRDRDPEAHPGRWGTRGRQQQCRGRAPRARSDVEAGARPRRLHRIARRLGADVPYFLLGGRPWAWRVETRSIRSAGSSEPTSSSWIPACPSPPRRCFAGWTRELTPRENSSSIFYFVSRDLEGDEAYPSPSQRPRGGGPGRSSCSGTAGGPHPGRACPGGIPARGALREVARRTSGSSRTPAGPDEPRPRSRPKASGLCGRGRFLWTSTAGCCPGGRDREGAREGREERTSWRSPTSRSSRWTTKS